MASLEPWQRPTPDITQNHGIGAQLKWQQGSQGGTVTITKDQPSTGVSWQTHLDAGPRLFHDLSYRPLPSGQTEVTWTLEGRIDMPLLGGYSALLMHVSPGRVSRLDSINWQHVSTKQTTSKTFSPWCVG